MKLASHRSGGRDGRLCVVSQDHKRAVFASGIAPSLREALEDWNRCKPLLEQLAYQLNGGGLSSSTFAFSESEFASVLPRTWLFADGSAFLHHIRLVRKARGAEPPKTLESVPLMYQAESARFLSPREDIPQLDFVHGTDFEAEVGVITDDVPMGVSPEQALEHIRLVVLINDVSLRGLIPEELAQGFGFFQSKPAKALSPLAVTPDELGPSWKGGRLHLPICVDLNSAAFGRPNAGAMHFHFGDLISHAARTRDLAAGTLIGSGTVSNDIPQQGSGCLAEIRTIETLQTGSPKTPFLKPGDHVKIWMDDLAGRSIFGEIHQRVVTKTKEVKG